MIKAYHATCYDKYKIIKKEGKILPSTHLRQKYSESSLYNLDKLAGDAQFVFLSSPRHIPVKKNETDIYGFVYEAEFLISKYKALVGYDLFGEYVNLVLECASCVAEGLLVKSEIAPYFEDPVAYQKINSCCEAIVQAIDAEDTDALGVSETIEMYKEKVPKLQKKIRREGEEALELLKQDPPDCSLSWWEILVRGNLPVEIAIGEIKKRASNVIQVNHKQHSLTNRSFYLASRRRHMIT